MYQASTAGTGCLGCGLGTEETPSGPVRILSINPAALQIAMAAHRGELTPQTGVQVSSAPGLPWWVWGVASVGFLGFVGAGIWWYFRRGEGEEAEE